MNPRLPSSVLRSLIPAAAALGVVVLTGCDSPGITRKAKAPDAVAAAKPAPVGQTTTTSAGVGAASPGVRPNDTFTVHTDGLAVSDAIAEACGIAPRDPEQPSAARFDYDSAALSVEDRATLALVARCLSEGPLKGRRASLTGRADARGEPEYNMTLGGSRADAVHRYLVDLGVGRDHLAATSRGEMDAVGTDEAGHARDRRVDIELLP